MIHVQNGNKFYIPVGHSLGSSKDRHRPILAKFPIAVYRFANEAHKENRPDTDNRNGKLFIKCKLQTQFLEPTLPCTEPFGNDGDTTAPFENA